MRLAAAWAVAFALLVAWAWHAVTALHQAERERVASAPWPIVAGPPGMAVIARDQGSAGGALLQLLGDRAAASGLRVSLSPLPASLDMPDGLVRARIVARGDEARLRRFSAAIEQGRPLVRWTRWSIAPAGAGGLTLAADAAAPWSTGGARRPATVVLASPAPAVAQTDRALFEPSQSAAADTTTATDAPTLTGIAGRLPDDAVALLRLPDGSVRSVRRGGQAGGWRVIVIAADRVRLSKAGREHVEILPAAVAPDQ